MRRVFIGALDGLATHDWLPGLDLCIDGWWGF
jgi:hypothetical protein